MDDVDEIARIKKDLQENDYTIHSTFQKKHKEFCVLIYHPIRGTEAWGFDENELAAYNEARNVLRLAP